MGDSFDVIVVVYNKFNDQWIVKVNIIFVMVFYIGIFVKLLKREMKIFNIDLREGIVMIVSCYGMFQGCIKKLLLCLFLRVLFRSYMLYIIIKFVIFFIKSGVLFND